MLIGKYTMKISHITNGPEILANYLIAMKLFVLSVPEEIKIALPRTHGAEKKLKNSFVHPITTSLSIVSRTNRWIIKLVEMYVLQRQIPKY